MRKGEGFQITPGDIFGELKVLERLPSDHNSLWLCRCACGRVVKVWGAKIRLGRTHCMPCKRARAFWRRVDVHDPDHCWEWKSWRDDDGYGRTTWGSKRDGTHRVWRAHVLAFFLSNGWQRPKDHVLHRCDNPPCCNPAHLFEGTDRDNKNDMIQKGRHAHGDRHYARTEPHRLVRGARHGCAKLTEDQVREIRRRHAEGASVYALATEYGVAGPTLGNIVKRRTWRHV